MLLLTLASLVLVGLSAFPFVSGRAIEPVVGFEHAVRAIEDARSAGADRWSTATLAAADSCLREARAEHLVQMNKLPPFRDFARARLQLEDARSRAELATANTRSWKNGVRRDSELAIDRATNALLEADAFRDARVLDAAARRRLQAARVQAVEAVLRQEDGDYLTARDMAETAEREAHAILDRATEHASRFVDGAEIERWRRWVTETVEESRGKKSSAIIIFKERNELVLYRSGVAVRRYPVELGRQSLDRKIMEGDGATPEGRYRIVAKKEGGETVYHRALLLDYPTEEDLARLAEAKRRGLVRSDARPGGAIEIHGEGGRGWDWTRGCMAMTNEDIDDLWTRIQKDTRVTIVGGDGEDGVYSRMVRAANKRKE